jgi:hypothetical protein
MYRWRVRAFMFVSASLMLGAFARAANDLPEHDAPFGLRFGMPQEQVSLPKTPILSKSSPLSILAGDAFMKSKEPFDQGLAYHRQQILLRACERTFDELFTISSLNEAWADKYNAAYSQENELTNFEPSSVLSSDDLWSYRRPRDDGTCALPDFIRHRQNYRQSTLYSVEVGGEKRNICLLFTAQGLTHLYVQRREFKDVLTEIYKRLDANANYQKFEWYSNDPNRGDVTNKISWNEGHDCARQHRTVDQLIASFDFSGPVTSNDIPDHAAISAAKKQEFIERADRVKELGTSEPSVVERRVWFEPKTRILISAKRFETSDGVSAHLKGQLLKTDPFVLEALHPYLTYTDLVRRGIAFRAYRERVLQVAKEKRDADEEAQRRKAEADRATALEKKTLVESFK